MNNKTPKLRFKGFTDAWEQRKLGDMMNVTSVKRIHQSDWTDAGIRFIRARDIVAKSKNEKITEPLFISEEKYKEYSALSGKVKIGDLLVTGVGTIGVPMLIDSEEPLYFKDGNVIWFKNENKIDGHFFYYSFIGTTIQNYIKETSGSGTVGTYTIDSGKKTPIPLPKDRDEQIRIGQFFFDLDNLVTLHQRKLEKIKSLKKAYLDKMFPKKGKLYPELRFAGFTNAWEQRKLSNVVDVGSGRDYKHLHEGNIPVYGTGGYMLSVSEALSEKDDAIGIGRKGTIDNPFILRAPFWTVDTLFYCVPKDNYDLNFTYCIFQNVNWKSKDESTGVPSLSKTTINNIDVMVPTLPEQKKIGDYFSTIDNLITLHQHKLEKLKQLKTGYLNSMFI